MPPTRRFGLCLVVLCSLAQPAVAHADAREQEMVDELNRVRAAHHLDPLRPAPSLERSAFAFADHLMSTDVFGHAEQIRASHRFRRLGEVLAWSSGWRLQRPATVRMWLASPAHRALILSRAFRYAGAGRSRGIFRGVRATIWVVQLGGL